VASYIDAKGEERGIFQHKGEVVCPFADGKGVVRSIAILSWRGGLIMSARISAAIGAGLLALAASLQASAATPVTMCDNYGRQWSITFGQCPADANMPAWVRCLTGARDVNNDLGCGPFPLDGIATLGLISVTAYDQSGNCQTAAWKGRYSTGIMGFSGEVSNNTSIPFGTFTLTLGACSSATAAGAAGDPAAK
jgi:hypothetical protein